jgi:predicted metal-dependent phosphoesterase TrpH
MIEAGHVSDTQEAFDRWLGQGCQAFMPRAGPPPGAVIDVIHQAGGIASLAHPGNLRFDPKIDALVDAGLDALEAFHPDHDRALVARYVEIARRLNLLLTGGSDFHGDPGHGLTPGAVTLPPAEFQRLLDARPHGGS